MVYHPLNSKRDEIRLITVLPLPPDSPEEATVECKLEKYCLNDAHHTLPYREYLHSKGAAGAWNDPRNESGKLGFKTELGHWGTSGSRGDDLTTHLPEFRYEWGDFMALSYTWGGPSNAQEIRVNGDSMLVTENAEACLRALRKKSYIQKGWKIWIDAICINQNDIAERASEIPRMRDIYTRAWTPLIWLGKQQGSDNALDLVRVLAKEYSTKDGVNRLTSTLRDDPQHFGHGRWRALNDIVCRQYWRRLWILQEAAWGRSTTPLLCGDSTVSWLQFSRAASLLSKTDEVINTYITKELEAESRTLDLTIWPSLQVVTEIQELQDNLSRGKRPGLFRLLNLSDMVFCTDPRDKVYGILGLMDPSIAELIVPDYTATVVDVYRSFTLAVIKATQSLDILRLVMPTSNSQFPSWVPEWLLTPETAPFSFSISSFATAGSSKASIETSPDGKLLTCQGYIVDTFYGFSTLWTKGWDPTTLVQSQGRQNPYRIFDGAFEALWKTLVGNRTQPQDPLKADYSSLLATPALQELQLPDQSPLKDLASGNICLWNSKFLRSNLDWQVAGKRFGDFLTPADKLTPEHIDAVHLRDALTQRDRMGLRRKLFTTHKGYVGLGLEKIQRDDVIAVLQGCSLPMVLRRAEEGTEAGWSVVCECYVHGIMDGEVEDWGLDLENIVLH